MNTKRHEVEVDERLAALYVEEQRLIQRRALSRETLMSCAGGKREYRSRSVYWWA